MGAAQGNPSTPEPDSLELIEFDSGSTRGDHGTDFEACRAVRRAVFVEEQGVPEALEWDGLDAEAHHFLVLGLHGAPTTPPVRRALGTARMRRVAGFAKAERVAVLREARTRGIGKRLMRALEEHARRMGLPGVVLHAQVTAIPFYEKLGYRARGGIFLDAGIDHREMTKSLV